MKQPSLFTLKNRPEFKFILRNSRAVGGYMEKIRVERVNLVYMCFRYDVRKRVPAKAPNINIKG